MSFAAPLFLAGLALIPLGVLAARAARRRRRRFAIRYPAAATLGAVVAVGPSWKRFIPSVLMGLAAAALTLALARPEATVAVPIERASVMLVMDASRSMLADDVEPTRLEAAQGAAHRFLERIPEQLQVGVVGYSTAPHTILDPTGDQQQAAFAVRSLIPDGGTSTGDALTAALDAVERKRGDNSSGRRPPAAIVLLSDGKTTSGSDPLVAARRAGQLKVPVYTVALGTIDGVIDGGPFQGPIQVPPDPETLQGIAELSGGRDYEVDDADELDRIYERLGSQVGTRRERREVSAPFAGAGLLLLIGGLAFGLARRGRLP